MTVMLLMYMAPGIYIIHEAHKITFELPHHICFLLI